MLWRLNLVLFIRTTLAKRSEANFPETGQVFKVKRDLAGNVVEHKARCYGFRTAASIEVVH
jgi:hypothetical protein